MTPPRDRIIWLWGNTLNNHLPCGSEIMLTIGDLIWCEITIVHHILHSVELKKCRLHPNQLFITWAIYITLIYCVLKSFNFFVIYPNEGLSGCKVVDWIINSIAITLVSDRSFSPPPLPLTFFYSSIFLYDLVWY